MSRLNEYNPEFGVVFGDGSELDKWIREHGGGGTTTGTKPGAATPAPKGELPPNSKVQGNGAIDPNGYQWHYTPQNGWEQGYMASAAAQKQAGVGPSAGGTGGGYTPTPRAPSGAVTQADIDRAGARQLAGSPGVYMTSQGQTYTRHADGTYSPSLNYGASASGRAQIPGLWQSAIGNAASPQQPLAGAIANSASPNSAQLPTTAAGVAANPYAGLAGVAGTLGANQGVTLPGFEQFNRPGAGVAELGRQDLYGQRGNTDLNTIYGGRQGSATQFPVTPGFRGEGQNGNSIAFANGGSGGGRIEPQFTFPGTQVNVPGSYVLNQGNVNDANRAYEVPFNIGPGGASFANIGGNNVQVNSADKGTGYGFALNAMPSSNVFATLGRNPSEDPATQAIQTLQLNAALNQFGGGAGAIQALTAANPNQFGGFHAGTGNNPFSGNGGTAQANVFGNLGSQPQNTPWTPPAAPAAPPPAADTTPYVTSTSRGGGSSAPAGNTAASVAGGITPQTPGYSRNEGGSTNQVPAFAPGAYGPAFGTDAQANAAVSQAIAALAAQKDDEQGGGGEGITRGFAGGGTVNVARGPVSSNQFDWKQQLIQLLQGPRRRDITLPVGNTASGPQNLANGGDVISLGRFAQMGGRSRPFANGGDVIAPVTPGKTAPELAQAQPSQATSSPNLSAQQELAGTGTISGKSSTTNQPASVAGEQAAPAMASATYQAQNADQQAALQPFYEAAAHAASLQHARDTTSYINAAAGLPKATEVPYFGQPNSQNMAPGQYLGYGSYVQNLINNIGSKYQGIQELGNPRDQAAIQQEINAAAAGAAPLQTISGAQQKLAELGAPVSNDDIAWYTQQLAATNAQLAGYGDPSKLDEGGLQQYATYQAQKQVLENQLSQAYSRNNAIQSAQAGIANLLQSAGLNAGQIAPGLAQYQTQKQALEQELGNAQKVGQLNLQLGNLLQTPVPKFAGGGSMVTPEEIVGIGVKTLRPYFRVGEPTRPGGPDMAERLTQPEPNKLHITPLHRPSVPMGKAARMAA